MERSVVRISSGSKKNRRKSLGRNRNRTELWTIGLRIVELSLKGLLVAMGKGETLFGESVTECTGGRRKRSRRV